MNLLTQVPQRVIRVRTWTPGTDYQSHHAHNAPPPSHTADFFLWVSNGPKERLRWGGGGGAGRREEGSIAERLEKTEARSTWS